ncbi:uncharacterized protein LOC119336163 [Triticum dicoccoides]|uniref:uncharacterized protein LOC119336163 n=1 Tax=Triticum dicoccoides TaxID=85692 RepID=UPI001891CE8B|nr:uncharacterized protein LOC119336163 [Triticum dicoccoides]
MSSDEAATSAVAAAPVLEFVVVGVGRRRCEWAVPAGPAAAGVAAVDAQDGAADAGRRREEALQERRRDPGAPEDTKLPLESHPQQIKGVNGLDGHGASKQ